jgi:hypothetical protein
MVLNQPQEVVVGDFVSQPLKAAEEINKEVAEVVRDHGGEMKLQAMEAHCLRFQHVLAAVPAGDVGHESCPVELVDELWYY